MRNLQELFYPITANPENTEANTEIVPCNKLKPFIRCFWGSPKPFINNETEPSKTTVIPDGCMDIIFEIDYLENKIDVMFYGINDGYFETNDNDKNNLKSVFAIRFYFWAASFFADDNMKYVKNTCVDVDYYFTDFKKALLNILIEKKNMIDRIQYVEKYLLKKLADKFNPNNDFLNAVQYTINSKGVVEVPEICNYVSISQRKLERIFLDKVGLSPKKVAGIVRFQNVWKDIYYSKNHNSLDLTFKYKYNSQSHFINDFKKYFNQTPLQAIKRK